MTPAEYVVPDIVSWATDFQLQRAGRWKKQDFYVPDRILRKIVPREVRWHCVVPGCDHHSQALDYGILPLVFRPGANSRWWDIYESWWACSQHWKSLRSDRALLQQCFDAGLEKRFKFS